MLKNEAIKGIKWTGVSTIVIGVLGPVFLFIQSIFFSPEEFAIISLATVIVAILKVLEDAGISQSIIQKNANDSEVSALLALNMMINVILAIVIVMLSSFISWIFDYEGFKSLSILIGVNTLFSGPLVIFKASLQKDMLFGLISSIEIIRKASFIVFATILFLLDFGIHGYLIGLMLSNLLTCLLYIYFSNKKTNLRVSIHFNYAEVSPFIKFAFFIALKNLIAEVTHNIDKIIIGIFLSKELLGLYSYAKQLLDQVRVLITTSFSSVLFTLFSKVKNSISILKDVYLKMTKYVVMISFPLFLGIFLSIDRAVPLILSDNWIGIELYFKILTFPIFLLSITAGIANPVLYSLGNSKISFKIDLISSVVYIALLFAFSSQGTIFVCIVYCVYILMKVFLLHLLSTKSLNISLISYYINSFKNVLIPNLFMVIAYVILDSLIPLNSIITFGIIVGTSALIYSLSSIVFNKGDTVNIIKMALGKS